MSKVIEAAAKPLPKLLKHPLLNKYEPTPMGANDLKKYAEQIKREGLHKAVVLLDGKALTHHNYYKACREYHIPVEIREFGSGPSDGTDPEAFVERVYSKASGNEPVAPISEPSIEAEQPIVEKTSAVEPAVAPQAEKKQSDEAVEAAKPVEAESSKKKPREPKETHVSAMLELAVEENINFFCNSKGVAYAHMFVDGHHFEIWPVASSTFRRKMQRMYRRKTKAVIDATSMSLVLDHFAAMADDNEIEEVHVRQAYHDGDLYVDLGDDTWRVVRIAGDGSGWSIVARSPVAFIRPKGLMPLPRPEEGGNLNMLREFVAVDDDGFVEVLMWLLGAYHPTGPYTALLAHGEKGSGKSTIGLVLRSLIDPNACMLRGGGETEEKIVLQAHNGRVVMLDNLSSISPGVSDTLCRVLSGSGFSTRRFHTNEEEVLFNETCPVLITSIGRLITRDDLLDRTLMVDTHRLAGYRKERKFKDEFKRVQPKILGALFQAVSIALANMDKTEETCQYRMSDFFLWSVAGEQALGLEPGTVERVYRESVKDANMLTLEASPVAQALISYIRVLHKVHKGYTAEMTAGEWMKALQPYLDLNKFTGRYSWPENPTQFGNRLRTVESSLKTIGIEVEHHRRHGGERKIKVTELGEPSQDMEKEAA